MPSYGLMVALAVLVSVGIISSANNDALLLARLCNSYNAYRNIQEIQLYALYLNDYVTNIHNETALNNLIVATEVSSAVSGIGFQVTNNSIILHTPTKPAVYAIIPTNSS